MVEVCSCGLLVSSKFLEMQVVPYFYVYRYPVDPAFHHEIQPSAQPPPTNPATPPRQNRQSQNPPLRTNGHADEDDDDLLLVEEFDVQGANANELLGYKDKEEDGDGGDGDGEDGDEDNDSDTKSCHLKFQRKVRLDATQRAEGNRRPGGLKTQHVMRKAWEVSTCFDLTLMTPLTAIRNPGIC
jgi:hypothetical protein